jgi:hypothetical protein
VYVEAPVGRCVRAEPPQSLLELALAAHPVPTPGLVPGDDDVNQALEEVALARLGRAPRLLEGLVRLEVASCARELEPGGV